MRSIRYLLFTEEAVYQLSAKIIAIGMILPASNEAKELLIFFD
jgi:hypothetical protein